MSQYLAINGSKVSLPLGITDVKFTKNQKCLYYLIFFFQDNKKIFGNFMLVWCCGLIWFPRKVGAVLWIL